MGWVAAPIFANDANPAATNQQSNKCSLGWCYEMLKSPLAGSFHRAAEHYDQTDPRVAAPADTKGAEIEEERFRKKIA
jgi:hypothetical protein